MAIAQQPPLLLEQTPALKAPGPASPLRPWIRNLQDLALDGEQCYRSAIKPWTKSRAADSKHDRCLQMARACLKRGEVALADYWIEQAQNWDSHEDRLLECRVWFMFGQSADADRQIVIAVENLPGMSKGRKQ